MEVLLSCSLPLFSSCSSSLLKVCTPGAEVGTAEMVVGLTWSGGVLKNTRGNGLSIFGYGFSDRKEVYCNLTG